jgi:hypothetical protein
LCFDMGCRSSEKARARSDVDSFRFIFFGPSGLFGLVRYSGLPSIHILRCLAHCPDQ